MFMISKIRPLWPDGQDHYLMIGGSKCSGCRPLPILKWFAKFPNRCEVTEKYLMTLRLFISLN